MSNWLLRSGSVNDPSPPEVPFRTLSAIEGKPRPVFWGCLRMSFQVLAHGNLTAFQQSNSGKGKSALGTPGASSYIWFATAILSFGEGPTQDDVGDSSKFLWFVQKGFTSYATIAQAFQFGPFLNGDYGQAAWTYPIGQANTTPPFITPLTYRGESYWGMPGLPLGSDPNLPQLSTAAPGLQTGPAAFSGTYDVNPKDIIYDAATNCNYGVGFPPASIDDWTTFGNYCLASGLVSSLALTDQSDLAGVLNTCMEGWNSAFVFRSGYLAIVPYGDQATTGNGVTYTPPSQPVYSLSDDDFVAKNGPPILCITKRPEEVENSIVLEYVAGDWMYPNQWPNNRGLGSFDPIITTAKDEASIDLYGLRQGSTRVHHEFTTVGAASMAAQLILGRQQILNTYQFTLLGKFILLDPMDIVDISESNTGLVNQWVRITEIKENQDGTLDITAEEYLFGTGAAPLYGVQTKLGPGENYNAPASDINPPLLFEPTDQLADGLEIWIAVSPKDPTLWGSCEVWVSYGSDIEANYIKVTTQFGSSNVGVLSAILPDTTAALIGPTLDTTHTLSVDLSKSQSQFSQGSLVDALNFATLLYVDGEYIAYENVTPTDTYAFDLTMLNRGGYGTDPEEHASGTDVVAINAQIIRLPYTQDRIGSTIFFKFPSSNRFGGGRQSLADVSAVSYTITGLALASPLPNVENFISTYVDNLLYLDWDQITDFRTPLLYEIRKGSSWDLGQFVGRYAHPHIPAIGDDDYWIRALVQPIAGLTVYSDEPTQLNVVGSILGLNVLASYEEGSLGWLGSRDATITVDGSSLRTTAGDVDGYYTIPDAHIASLGRVAPCAVQIVWTSEGVPLAADWFFWIPGTLTPGSGYTDGQYTGVSLGGGHGSGAQATVVVSGGAVITVTPTLFGNGYLTGDVLTIPALGGTGSGASVAITVDWFQQTDVFQTVSSTLIDVHPEIAISQDGVTFGDWQRYSAGFYSGYAFKARMFISSLDQSTFAFLTSFRFVVYAPTRVDNFVDETIAAGAGTTITFRPDGGSATPFNGGPGGTPLPNVVAHILNGAVGETAILTSLSLSSVHVAISSGISRNINLQASGY